MTCDERRRRGAAAALGAVAGRRFRGLGRAARHHDQRAPAAPRGGEHRAITPPASSRAGATADRGGGRRSACPAYEGINLDATLRHWTPYGVASRTRINVVMDWTVLDA